MLLVAHDHVPVQEAGNARVRWIDIINVTLVVQILAHAHAHVDVTISGLLVDHVLALIQEDKNAMVRWIDIISVTLVVHVLGLTHVDVMVKDMYVDITVIIIELLVDHVLVQIQEDVNVIKI